MSRAATGSTLNSSDLRLALSVVIISLLYRLWQRPSAVSEATIAEFEAAQRISDDEMGKSCWIMTVARHKTAWEGPANITMTAEDYRLTCQYVRHIWPKCNPTASNLLVGLLGKPIKQPDKNIKWLGKKYGVQTHCCTDLRQVGGTETRLRCDEPTVQLISHQMSHSHPVHFKHYEKLGDQMKAVAALRVWQRLAFGSDNSSNDSEPLPKQKCHTVEKIASLSAGKKPLSQARVAYTPAEEEVIRRYFAKNIRDCRSAKIMQCRDFLFANPMQCTPKQIQDKVCQLYLSK